MSRVADRIHLYVNKIQIEKSTLEYKLETLINNESIDIETYYITLDKILDQINILDTRITKILIYLNNQPEKEKNNE